MNKHIKKLAFIALAFICVIGVIFGNYRSVAAAVVYDQTTGLYADDFADGSGVANFTNTEINTGAVKLVNGFSFDYYLSFSFSPHTPLHQRFHIKNFW
jgi:hypothetical protein